MKPAFSKTVPICLFLLCVFPSLLPAGTETKLSAGAGRPSHPRERRTLLVPEHTSILTVATLVKSKEFRGTGKKGSGTLVLSVRFLKKNGKAFPKPRELTWTGKFAWAPASLFARIPPGAEKVELTLELRDAEGEVLFDKTELFWGLPDEKDRENLIVDGGFEYYNALSLWFVEGQTVRTPGREGRTAMTLKMKQEGNAAVSQDFIIPEAEKIQKSEFVFDFKLDRVRTSRPGGGFKALLEFWDSNGKPCGQTLLGPWQGVEGWSHFSESISIPASARRGTVSFELENASGTAWFDEVRLNAFSAEGPVLRPLESRSDTRRWKIFEPAEGDLKKPAEAGSFLDAPAGKHGFLTVKDDGRFYFEDGTRARFFGVNLQPPLALPRHKQARELAARLAGLGFNLVRLTQLDAPFSYPNLFGNSPENTRHLSEESLDRLDYFIDQLKKRGIYVQLPLLMKREFKHGDDVEAVHALRRGARGPALFDPRLIELQKEYAQQLLTHKNPYTKKTLAEEPALAMIEIVNENSLCRFHHAKALLKLPSFYRKQLEDLWVKYVRDHQLAPDPEKARGTLEDVRNPEVRRFLAEAEGNYFRDMQSFLKKNGVRIPIEGSNFPLDGWDLAMNSEMDFIDRHVYWDRPEGGFNGLMRFHNLSAIRQIAPPEFGARADQPNPVVALTALRMKGKPLVVGEWNFDWPNEFRAVGPLLMTVYALFQDWDGLVLFNYEGHLKPASLTDGHFFDISSKPELLQQIPVAAGIFHRRDIRPAQKRETFSLFGKEEVPPFLGLKHGIDRVLGSEPPSYSGSENPAAVESDTGELKWDSENGLVTVNAPKFQAVIGTPSKEGVRLGKTVFLIQGDFAVVSLFSLDGRPLESSEHLLVSAFARSENKDMVYNATRTFLRSFGTGPVLMEPVEGEILIPADGSKAAEIFTLDPAGNRKSGAPAKVQEGSFQLSLGQAGLYEVVIKR